MYCMPRTVIRRPKGNHVRATENQMFLDVSGVCQALAQMCEECDVEMFMVMPRQSHGSKRETSQMESA